MAGPNLRSTKNEMNAPKIEHNIPIPANIGSRAGSMANTLCKMAIGDSVVINKAKAPSWRCVAYRLKVKVAIRDISATEVRLWRTK